MCTIAYIIVATMEYVPMAFVPAMKGITASIAAITHVPDQSAIMITIMCNIANTAATMDIFIVMWTMELTLQECESEHAPPKTGYLQEGQREYAMALAPVSVPRPSLETIVA
mmetsp:Transcript_29349/g.43084  ORF Transcript_29349/g.43084 Transcript_29349/m.43084 type:complete len:112 (-) Transcript_29349:433-768(-)